MQCTSCGLLLAFRLVGSNGYVRILSEKTVTNFASCYSATYLAMIQKGKRYPNDYEGVLEMKQVYERKKKS